MQIRSRQLAAAQRLPLGRSAFALLGYLALSFGYFGLPVVLASGRPYVGYGPDPEIFIWSFGWWAHALSHGLNPLYSRAIWVPGGFNLAYSATAQGVAALFVPLTLLIGPLAAYNVAAVALPALAAWTSYLLCRRLTGRTWAALVGGYLFGFSSYMLGEEEGHVHMTAVFLLPLLALLVVDQLQGRLSDRRFILYAGLLLGVQLWFSTELFVTVSLALAVALSIAALTAPTLRGRLRALVVVVVGAYGLAALLAAPLLYYALPDLRAGSVNPPGEFPTDVLNAVVPTGLSLVGFHWATAFERFSAGNAESGGYLGLPTLAVVCVYALRRWRTPAGRFLLAALACALVASYGSSLQLNGHTIVGLPWRWLSATVPLDNVLPARLSVYVSLIAAVLVATWAAGNSGRARGYLVPLLAIVALLPMLGDGYWKTVPPRPAFFTTGLYRSCLARGSSVLALPYNNRGDSILWQAESGYWFGLAEGYVTLQWPRPYLESSEVFFQLEAGLSRPWVSAREIVAFARSKDVAAILVADQAGEAAWARSLATVIQPLRVGGVELFPLTAAARPAACTGGAAAGAARLAAASAHPEGARR